MQTSHFALYQGLSPPVQWSTKRKKIESLKKENPPNEKCQSQAKKKKNRQEDRFTNTRNVLIIQSKLCWIELSALRTLHESSTLWIFFLGDSITKTNSVWNDKLCHMTLICSSYHSTPFILTSKAISTKLCMKLLNRSWEWVSYQKWPNFEYFQAQNDNTSTS